MLEKIDTDDFYIICPDNDVTGADGQRQDALEYKRHC